MQESKDSTSTIRALGIGFLVAVSVTASLALVRPVSADNTSLIVSNGTVFKTQDTNRPWFYAGSNIRWA